MKKYIIIILFIHSIFTVRVKAQDWTLTSPDGNLTFEMRSIKPQGELEYNIKYRDQAVILPSRLAINYLEQNIEIENVLEITVDTVWKPVYGERSSVRDNYRQKTFVAKPQRRGGPIHIIVRAYDAGIAFRYFFANNHYLRIDSEKTTFTVPENTYCWFAPYAQAEHKRLPVKDWTGEAERPLTLQLANGLYAALGEAEMVNYSRTKFFVQQGEENIIRCRMYDPVEEIAPFATPWRVVMVAEQPKDLLMNNDIFLNLNEPCKIENTEWIKPGKVMRVTQLNTEAALRMVDLAVARKLDYIHFDAGWYGPEASIDSDPCKPIAALDLPEVLRYAKSKNVGVWLYVNNRALVKYLDDILPLYQSWGIAGIKFGFVQVGSFRWTTWMHEAVRKCVEHNIMVNVHDEYRPTGFSRTYPNFLTQEGVRGNEEFPDGVNNTTLPFTRFLAGAADATVCYYHRKDLKPVLPLNARSLLNTPCHQMALALINYSPLQYLYWYDNPDDFQDEPELAYFDEIHTVWDDTRVLDGRIGEYISMARRKDDTWFAACLTNNDARKTDFSLNFLDPAAKYELTLYTDGDEKVKTRTRVAIQKKQVDHRTVLKLDLLPRGGCAMIIKKK